MFKVEKYNKDREYSYTFGAFPTFELIINKPQYMVCLFLHSKLKITNDIQELIDLCVTKKIEIIYDDKSINRVADKENCFVVGVFKKFSGSHRQTEHLVLVNPSDMGNMGTIMRTALGFGFKDINIIKPCVDIFNPKVVRASMGAIFSLNICEFDSVENYLKSNNNTKYFFMLNGKKTLGEFKVPTEQYDIVFGNEASGLPDYLINEGESVVIKHNKKIDSLNLPISVGMAIYEFKRG